MEERERYYSILLPQIPHGTEVTKIILLFMQCSKVGKNYKK
jgi:hypothetical protein